MKIIGVLDSLWEADYAGPLIRDEYLQPAVRALRGKIHEVVRRKGIGYATMRLSDERICNYLNPGHDSVDLSSCTAKLDLSAKSTDFIWEKVFRKKDCQRKYIRRFERAGYQTRMLSNDDDWATFYKLYRDNIEYIGGSLFHFDFFRNIRNMLFPDNFNILLAENDKGSVGTIGFFVHRDSDTVFLTFLGLDRELKNTFHTSYYMYWRALLWAEENGFRHVSFGSTPADPNDVHYHIKAKFGVEFNKNYIVCLAFKKGLFSMRGGAVKLWRIIGPWLPRGIRQRTLAMAESP